MKWLLWKDLCLNRSLLVVAVILLLLPYAFFLSLAWYHHDRVEPGLRVAAAIWSLVWLQLPWIFVAGQAFAGERAERSVEFLGSLPVPRGSILASKLLVLLATAALIWIPNLLVLAEASRHLTETDIAAYQFFPWVRGIPLVALALGGSAWFFSAKMDNPIFATCLGVFTPAIAFLAGLVVWRTALARSLGCSPNDFTWAQILFTVFSVLGFVAGSVLYLRRRAS